MTSRPFLPVPGNQPMLPGNASAAEQFGRLLDALLVLDAEGSCRVADLALRVGLPVARLRDLLSAYMVAGAEALGVNAPFNIMWGTAEGALGADEDDDALHEVADVVHLDGSRKDGQWLVGDVGRRPVMVQDVARALLAGKVALEGDLLRADQRAVLGSLVAKLSEAMRATVDTPADLVATTLQKAVREGRQVRFRYLHPWTGEAAAQQVVPYDLRRQRDRLVLDAGDGGPAFETYDVGGITDVEVLDAGPGIPDLPPVDRRTPQVRVTLAVPAHSRAESWLLDGWSGTVVGPLDGDRVQVAIGLDGDTADPGVVERLGVLLLQLGGGVEVLEPASLRTAPRAVAQRLLDLHPA